MNKSPDLHLAFDVGHSSIGWAVLRTPIAKAPELLGCGAVIFPADDCLAAQRRQFRRQRRHIRSTRLRIARMKNLLLHLGVMTEAELNRVSSSAPWFLAARILATDSAQPVPDDIKLTWPQLWDVLRWYAHNRGYDGNRRWSAADAAAKKDDTEKAANAIALMEKHGTKTMAETMAAYLARYRTDIEAWYADNTKPQPMRFKGLNAAFPRETVAAEVHRLLDVHCGLLPHLDAPLIAALLDDWKTIACPAIKLPARYEGGLLFGQLVPRFENRIIATCPKTGEKVPSRRSREFLDFRWTMLLANLRIALPGESELHELSIDDRLKMDRRARALGFFRHERDKLDKKTGTTKPGVNELREELRSITGCDRDNLDGLLFDGNMREALKVYPVTGNTEAFRIAWSAFDGPSRDEKTGAYCPDRFAGRFISWMLRGTPGKPHTLSIASLLAELDKLGASNVADRLRAGVREAASKNGKFNEKKYATLQTDEFGLDRLSGRARYGRTAMMDAVAEFMRRDHPLHPLQKGGSLERTEAILEEERQCALDEMSNNHLVRHRLRLLAGDPDAKPAPFRGLLDDLLKNYADGDHLRVSRITIELARDLQEMSGKNSKEKAALHNQKLDTHERASELLAEAMRAEGIPFVEADGRRRFNASLIRKARVALDMEAREDGKKPKVFAFRCPYTDRVHTLGDVVRGRVELDHIVPRSKRLSDALEAMVLTSPEINREKKNRTALEFIREMNLPENREKRQRLGVVTENQYLAFVQSLTPKTDPFRRARMTDERPSDDDIRCWRRKELFLVPKWEVKEFTPADLTKTRYLTKLAGQRIEARFPENHRPPVITVSGAVTKSFRDRAWRLLPLLIDRTDKTNQTAINATFAKWKAELAQGRSFNLKDELRGVTHLHHAIDAAALAFITETLVQPPHTSLNGRLATLIVKRKLSPEEREEFENLIRDLRLPRFFRWGKDNEIWVEDLPELLKEQLHQRLAERRIVQHLPREMAGMRAELNAWRVVKVEGDVATLRQRTRQADGTRPTKPDREEKVSKLVGLKPGKLHRLKAALIIGDNYGLALEPEPMIIPHHHVWKRLGDLKARNGGKPVTVLRSGMLVRVPKGKFAGIWRIFSVKNNTSGMAVDMGQADVVRLRNKTKGHKINVLLASLIRDGMEIGAGDLTGLATLPKAAPE